MSGVRSSHRILIRPITTEYDPEGNTFKAFPGNIILRGRARIRFSTSYLINKGSMPLFDNECFPDIENDSIPLESLYGCELFTTTKEYKIKRLGQIVGNPKVPKGTLIVRRKGSLLAYGLAPGQTPVHVDELKNAHLERLDTDGRVNLEDRFPASWSSHNVHDCPEGKSERVWVYMTSARRKVGCGCGCDTSGPWKSEESEAIDAWNKMMAALKT